MNNPILVFEFQFQTGSIKRNSKFEHDRVSSVGFNSKLVRLKE